jgi:hypothetical protein
MSHTPLQAAEKTFATAFFRSLFSRGRVGSPGGYYLLNFILEGMDSFTFRKEREGTIDNFITFAIFSVRHIRYREIPLVLRTVRL